MGFHFLASVREYIGVRAFSFCKTVRLDPRAKETLRSTSKQLTGSVGTFVKLLRAGPFRLAWYEKPLALDMGYFTPEN